MKELKDDFMWVIGLLIASVGFFLTRTYNKITGNDEKVTKIQILLAQHEERLNENEKEHNSFNGQLHKQSEQIEELKNITVKGQMDMLKAMKDMEIKLIQRTE